jgi:hypothetical protein
MCKHPWVRIPPLPPLAHRKPEMRSLVGPFFFLFQRGLAKSSDFGDWRFSRNWSLNALRLFPSALCSNRDGFKKWRTFRMLAKSSCAAVEAGSSALGTDRDTRRRRTRAGRSELQCGVSLQARGRNGRKADGQTFPFRAFTSVSAVPLRNLRIPSRSFRTGIRPRRPEAPASFQSSSARHRSVSACRYGPHTRADAEGAGRARPLAR